MWGQVAAWVMLVAFTGGCRAELLGGLDERQSREVTDVLAAAGIPAETRATGDTKDRRYRVSVAAGEADRASAVLSAEALPRMPRPGFDSLYGSASMIPTATEEKARFLDALSGELGAHLERLHGVVSASVLVSVPERDPLAPATGPGPTASVLLEVKAGSAPPQGDVQRLVAGAVEGLAPGAVTVVTTERPTPPGALPGGPSRLGPFTVGRNARGPLLAIIAGSLGAVLLMAAWATRTHLRTYRGNAPQSRNAPETSVA